MYKIEKLVAAKWHYQCSTQNEKEAIQHVQTYARDEVLEFKTCDAVRAVDTESGEVIAQFPEA